MSFIVKRITLATLLAMAAVFLPELDPAPLPGSVLLRIPPAVRQIVGSLRLVDIPPARRKRNWLGRRGQGSCVHAALVHLWHWQGRHDLAEWWRSRHGDGETADGLSAKLDAAGIRFAETRSGDVRFLEWAIRTRRGAAVVVQQGTHMVNLVGLDDREAYILDSNRPEQIDRRPREQFLREWRDSGGWGVTPVGIPAAPSPWVVKTAEP